MGRNKKTHHNKRYLIYNECCDFCVLLAEYFQRRGTYIIANTNMTEIRKIYPTYLKCRPKDFQKDVHLVVNNIAYSKGGACAVLIGNGFYYGFYLRYRKFCELGYTLMKKNKWIVNFFLRMFK
jgi:hypothetical protein